MRKIIGTMAANNIIEMIPIMYIVKISGEVKGSPV